MGIKRRTLLAAAATLPMLAAGTAGAAQGPGMDAMECIFTRRSVRRYLDTPVPDELVTRLLEAAMTAPSAHNQQPWRFVVVKNPERLKACADAGARPAASAGAAILVCGEPGAVKSPQFWPQDCSNAAMSILLAANALGLGAVWTAAYPDEERMGKYRSLFKLPDGVLPLCLICLGWPEKPGWRENRFKPERVKREVWS